MSPLLTRLRNRRRRLREHRWRTAAYVSTERHIIMGGAPRSGTTLLRRLLDRHPSVTAGAETKLFVPAAFNLEWLARSYELPLAELADLRDAASSQAAFIDAFAGRVLTARGTERWAEKTPMNIRNLDWIAKHFPEAAVVHIIRDGRDVVCSMRQHPDWRWRDGAWEKVLVPRPVATYAERWVSDTALGMAWRDHPAYTEIRYEDLAADPRTVLRAVCRGVGLEPDADWLAAIESAEAVPGQRPDDKGAVTVASVGRWREELSSDEAAEVERICGARLRELGYEIDGGGAAN